MYQRLDYLRDGRLDFELIRPPALDQYDRVLGFWEVFREAIDETPKHLWHDQLLFERYRLYYDKLATLLHPSISVEALTPDSRHKFYVSRESVESPDGILLRLAGIQLLLGYEDTEIESAPSSGDSGPVGTGRADLDIVASLIQLEVPGLEYLCSQYSVDELGLIAEHLWESRLAASGKVTERQRQEDYKTWQAARAANPEAMRAAEEEAQNFLLNRTGPQAMKLARIKQDAPNSDN